MNKKGMVVLCGLILFCFLMVREATVAFAKENETSIGITITEPELYLESVSTPVFDRITAADFSQKVTAKDDLVIKVRDVRAMKEPWQLKYTLSTFKKEDTGRLDKQVTYTLERGRLQTGGQTVPEEMYEANRLDDPFVDSDPILRVVKASFSEYEYRVAGDGITLAIPANLPAGKYMAIQTVLLENVSMMTE